MLTQERLKEYLHYDRETGIFTWLKRSAKRIKIGDKANIFNKILGYDRVKFLYVTYSAHRLAWFYVYGEFPEKGFEIDHIDNVSTNNRIANLRLVTHSQNMLNQRVSKKSTSGHKCIYRTNSGWIVRPKLNGKNPSLGTFKLLEDAVRVRNEWAKINHGEYIHHTLL
jgi:hypothetical protein